MSKHTETMENKMVNNNIKGRALEKEGKTEQAIKLYEFNVPLRVNNVFTPFAGIFVTNVLQIKTVLDVRKHK